MIPLTPLNRGATRCNIYELFLLFLDFLIILLLVFYLWSPTKPSHSFPFPPFVVWSHPVDITDLGTLRRLLDTRCLHFNSVPVMGV
jgi:hypothetical protein